MITAGIITVGDECMANVIWQGQGPLSLRLPSPIGLLEVGRLLPGDKGEVQWDTDYRCDSGHLALALENVQQDEWERPFVALEEGWRLAAEEENSEQVLHRLFTARNFCRAAQQLERDIAAIEREKRELDAAKPDYSKKNMGKFRFVGWLAGLVVGVAVGFSVLWFLVLNTFMFYYYNYGLVVINYYLLAFGLASPLLFTLLGWFINRSIRRARVRKKLSALRRERLDGADERQRELEFQLFTLMSGPEGEMPAGVPEKWVHRLALNDLIRQVQQGQKLAHSVDTLKETAKYAASRTEMEQAWLRYNSLKAAHPEWESSL